MITIMTPQKLIKQTTLPQGATNSISQFQKIITKILQNHIPSHAMLFLDNVRMKSPLSRYGNKEVMPKI